ncbi:uncharacterized protein LOC110028697 isoform X2 [Phalaenopsis equestris]|uniref:uncharacterized protein LOC110028697 isoform X2 n=1 Tax=Phalaenopsis equestris TaxID=78828 RepID=UPI0009E3FC65|nr:uncharacterized protein LOC110028697 isoform X2 [Phalaenopsis equestris]
MEESAHSSDLNLGNYGLDEEFRSCCEEDEDWQDAEESLLEERVEGREEVPLWICQGQEEGDQFSSRLSDQLLQEDVEASLMEFGEKLEDSMNFSDGVHELVTECSLRLHEGDDQDFGPKCFISLSKVHDEDVSESTLRLCEGHEEVVSLCSLALPEDHEEDVSQFSLRLSEGEEERILDCELRFSQGHDDGAMDSSPRFCEANGSDVSETSLQLSEDDEDISECSLIFSEDHEDDILKCSIMLFENHDEDDDDEFSVRIFSKGVSMSENCGLDSRISGIGVIMEKPHGVPFLQVQKKLDFFVEELIAEHLALLDGLLEALRNGCRKVLAFTDSNEVYLSITRSDSVEGQLLIALRERIQEIADKFESFVLKLAPKSELKKPLKLAQEATGILCQLIECSTCGEDKHLSKMIEMDCSHDLCFDCMGIYVKTKFRSSPIAVKCPQPKCKSYISNSVCRSFLPSSSFESLEGALAETEARNLWRFYCPFPDCSMLLHSHHHSPDRESTLIKSNIYCIECPECCRFVCSRCQVPWHSTMRCEEYQNLIFDERNVEDLTLHQLARRNSWRRCQQCRQMLELVEGCYRVSCRYDDGVAMSSASPAGQSIDMELGHASANSMMRTLNPLHLHLNMKLSSGDGIVSILCHLPLMATQSRKRLSWL